MAGLRPHALLLCAHPDCALVIALHIALHFSCASAASKKCRTTTAQPCARPHSDILLQLRGATCDQRRPASLRAQAHAFRVAW
eukprot:6208698-Pleurochrysis_carterae.AAC.1